MRRDEWIFDLAQHWSDPPSGGPGQRWAIGGGLSAALAFWGLACCWTGHATTFNIRLRGMGGAGEGLLRPIDGPQAFTFGLMLMAIAAFVHFQWFWGNHPKLRRYHELGKFAATLAVIFALIGHAWSWIAA